MTSHEYFLDTFTLQVFSSTATPTSLLLWSKSQIEKYSVERMFLLCGGRCSFEAKLFGPILVRQRSEDVSEDGEWKYIKDILLLSWQDDKVSCANSSMGTFWTSPMVCFFYIFTWCVFFILHTGMLYLMSLFSKNIAHVGSLYQFFKSHKILVVLLTLMNLPGQSSANQLATLSDQVASSAAISDADGVAFESYSHQQSFLCKCIARLWNPTGWIITKSSDCPLIG